MTARPRQPLLRAEQVAELIGVSPRTAADLMRQMPRINIGRSNARPRWAVNEADVYAWMDRRQVPPDDMTQARQRRKRAAIVRMDGLLDASGHIARRK